MEALKTRQREEFDYKALCGLLFAGNTDMINGSLPTLMPDNCLYI